MCQICLSGFLRLRRSHIVSFILTWISILYCSGFLFIQVEANLGKSYLFPLNCSVTNIVGCSIPFQSQELECLWVYQIAFGKPSWHSKAFPVTGTLLKVNQSWQEWILMSWRTPRWMVTPRLHQTEPVAGASGVSWSVPVPSHPCSLPAEQRGWASEIFFPGLLKLLIWVSQLSWLQGYRRRGTADCADTFMRNFAGNSSQQGAAANHSPSWDMQRRMSPWPHFICGSANCAALQAVLSSLEVLVQMWVNRLLPSKEKQLKLLKHH